MNSDWLDHEVECPNVSTIKYDLQKEGIILCNIIGEVHTSIYRPLSLSYPFISLVRRQDSVNKIHSVDILYE